MNWIRPCKRLAIYLRDGLACAYCGATIEDVRMTLDHLRPHGSGGSNKETNLVSCCHLCNSSRGKRSWKTFAEDTAAYRGMRADEIVAHIMACRKRPLDIDAAKELISRRGGFSAALTREVAA